MNVLTLDTRASGLKSYTISSLLVFTATEKDLNTVSSSRPNFPDLLPIEIISEYPPAFSDTIQW
jgi:hypothetical protein